MTARDKRVERLQTRTAFSVPFWAPGMARLPVLFDETVESNGVPTACTDGERIKWHPEDFDKLTDAQACTKLVHEVAHPMLGHLWRAPEECRQDAELWDLWNQAADHEVNLMLKEFSALVMGKGLADPFPFPDPPEAYCADPRFTGMNAENIYSILRDERKPQQKPQNSPKAGKPGQGQGQGKQTAPRPQPQTGQGKPAPHSMPAFGGMEKPQPGQQAKEKDKARGWKQTLIQAATIQESQSKGSVPAGIKRIVGEHVEPKVPWYSILRSLLREQCSDDWDFLTPAMEYSASGFLLPSMRSEKVGPVVFGTDTSGSTQAVPKLVAQFQGEKQNCLDELKPSKLLDIYCDSVIQKIEEYVPGDVIGRDVPGGGGTSFVPVFDYVRTLENCKAVVYLTDLMGDFGDDPGVPVIWVTWTKDGTAPFGHVVYAGDL